MRKSNNYFKFLEYVTYGKDHDSTIDKGNSVLECKSYASISDIEYRYNITFGLENEWLTLKSILINEDTLYVYYLENENSTLVGVYLLDNFKTQKELKDTITEACTEFLYDILLEKSEAKEKHYDDYTSEDFINAGIAKECTDCPDFCEEDCIENAECAKGNDVFEGCKTVKDVMEVKQDLNTRFGKKVQQYFDTDCLELNNTIIAKIENINHCPNQNTCCIVSPFVHCDYNYKSDNCIKAHKNFIHDCEQLHKQMKARSNPNWHHVSLATLANIDNDMLDEKRQRYFKIYKELIKTVSDLHKCKTAATYEIRWWKFKQAIADDIYYKGTTLYMTRFLDAKISMCNVECGLWSSVNEKATSFIKSRRYGYTTLK